MTNNQALQQIRLICSSGLPPLMVMPLLSDALHKVLPCFSFTFIFTDQQAKPLAYYAENLDESTHKLFSEKGHLLTSEHNDPASFPHLFGLPNAYGNMLNPPAQYYKGSIYTNFFAPNGIQHFIDMTISHNGLPLVMIGIFREEFGKKSAKKSGYSKKEIALLPLLYSHLKHLSLSKSSLEARDNLLDSIDSKAFGLTFDDNEIQDDVMAEVFTECERNTRVDSMSASITVNANGDILFASQEAINLLKQGLTVKHRYLLEYQHSMQPLVKFLCQSLARKFAHSYISPPMRYLPVPNGMLIIRAYQMNALTSANGLPEYYSIHIELVQPTRLRVLRQLTRYQLPPKVMSVAWFISIGLNNVQVCERLSIQPSTLRSYLKVLYNRLNVNSHEQLKLKLTNS
ncbi:helix-turn-helix transcriptional regulator [Psychrobacter sp. FME5]|uniref:helix-turn-helix transcriptional regulator n=1 Tax=Psychrobacter sp. FME5 TaxID=2487706 RepID=UPI0017878172|nr:hypothetical protein [Psychrobacter sp. FME5]MBE0445889.1 hypothetical protein [Psychrobacter sp. FME5]